MVFSIASRVTSRVLVVAAVASLATALISPASARPSRHHVHHASWNHSSDRNEARAERPRYRHSRQARRSYERSERRAARSAKSRRHFASRTRRDRERFDHQILDHRTPIGASAALGATLNTHEPLMPQDGVSSQEIATPRLVRVVPTLSSGNTLVAAARRYIGRGNPTGRRSLWCARFMNMVLQQQGFRGTGSDMASSFAGYGRRLSGPQVGAIAVMSRGRRGGHVGVVSGFDKSGNPVVVSGNHGRRVAEAVYSRRRIYAYVMP